MKLQNLNFDQASTLEPEANISKNKLLLSWLFTLNQIKSKTLDESLENWRHYLVVLIVEYIGSSFCPDAFICSLQKIVFFPLEAFRRVCQCLYLTHNSKLNIENIVTIRISPVLVCELPSKPQSHGGPIETL